MQAINTNIFSENAQRQLLRTNNLLQTSMQRLSSGLRINSAKDDAAGLQISNGMSAQIGGLTVAIRNANDGISLAQTAEGAMDEMTNILLRMRDLSIQGSNATYSSNDNAALDAEYQALNTELTRITTTAKFNGQALLNGSGGDSGTFSIAVDYEDGATNNIDIDLTTDLSADGVPDGDLTDASNAQSAVAAIDTAISNVDSARAALGAIQSRLQSTVNNLSNVRENLSAARSRIMDTDFAAETANLSKYQVMQQASTAMLAQANAMPQNVLYLLGRG
ncbi:MAG: flagellin [Endozoicomonas sp. (ex Botrylloides leachii)]|nr:flagellin [Endozoicomonas sp. (ex Botrylloides leachii)]